MLRIGALCCVLAAAMVAPVAAASTSSNSLFPAVAGASLTRQLTEIARKDNLPSVAVRVVVPKKGQYTFITGVANLQTKAPRTLTQPFRIASITKPFAATAVLVLVDQGRLKTSDSIAKWYPDFPNAKLITIDDLLRMRSGIPAPDDDAVLARVYDAPLAPAPPLGAEMATYAKLKAQFKPPNTIGVYTDFNYDVLAGIVKQVTGDDIGTVITRTVIAPLHLRDTSFPTGTGIPGNLRGYGWNPKTKRFDDKTLFNPPLAGAAGAVISSVDDLETFVRAVCRGTLLKPATSRAQLRGQPLKGTDANYGEGIATGHGFCGHSGTINGFSSDMYYVPKFDLSLVISVNRLDRNNESRSTPILAAVSKAVVAAFGKP
jgi:D-alanyl-D-alanine carboxypeptidase